MQGCLIYLWSSFSDPWLSQRSDCSQESVGGQACDVLRWASPTRYRSHSRRGQGWGGWPRRQGISPSSSTFSSLNGLQVSLERSNPWQKLNKSVAFFNNSSGAHGETRAGGVGLMDGSIKDPCYMLQIKRRGTLPSLPPSFLELSWMKKGESEKAAVILIILIGHYGSWMTCDIAAATNAYTSVL